MFLDSILLVVIWVVVLFRNSFCPNNLSMGTWPDIAYLVNYLSWFQEGASIMSLGGSNYW
jgi:hypothetical protein